MEDELLMRHINGVASVQNVEGPSEVRIRDKNKKLKQKKEQKDTNNTLNYIQRRNI